MSLVTTPTRALATCAYCASTRVMKISMTLTDGSDVDFVSCHACERKTWTESSSGIAIAVPVTITVTEVLRKAQKPAK